MGPSRHIHGRLFPVLAGAALSRGSAALPGFSESIYGGQAASSKKMYGEKEHPLIEQLKREHEARGVPSAAAVAAKTERVRAASEKLSLIHISEPTRQAEIS